MHTINHPEHFPAPVRERFRAWCGKIGLSYEPRHLPFILLGMVRTASLSFIAWLAKAFSLLRRQAPLVKPPANTSELPVWHNVFCRNEHRHTYYGSPLISQGVTTWGAFFGEHHPRYHRTLPWTWKPVYTAAHRTLKAVMSQEIFDLLATWTLCWGNRFFLKFVSPDPNTLEQQPS